MNNSNLIITFVKRNKIMGNIEFDKCDFCHIEKPVKRTYLRPSKYVKSDDITVNQHLYNEGSYFIYIKTCYDCGEPKI